MVHSFVVFIAKKNENYKRVNCKLKLNRNIIKKYYQ